MWICRIAYGISYVGNVEAFLVAARRLTIEKIDETMKIFLDSNLKMIFLLDCLLIAGTMENGRDNAFEYISQLAELLKVEENEMIFLANTAKVILMQDIWKYGCEIPNTYGELFDCYLDAFQKYFEFKVLCICDKYKNDCAIFPVGVFGKTRMIKLTSDESSHGVLIERFGTGFYSTEHDYKCLGSEKREYPSNHVLVYLEKTIIGDEYSPEKYAVTTNHLLAWSKAKQVYDSYPNEIEKYLSESEDR